MQSVSSEKQLTSLKIVGYKSIKACDMKLSALNILIGAKGAGKSNFINFFRLIGEILAANIHTYVSRQGRDGCYIQHPPLDALRPCGQQGASSLRDKPNVHWKQGRGMNLASTSWVGESGAARINVNHFILDEKNDKKNEGKEAASRGCSKRAIYAY